MSFRRKQNFIIRPYGERVHFVQLDDLSHEELKSLSAVSCLILATSPESWACENNIAQCLEGNIELEVSWRKQADALIEDTQRPDRSRKTP